jgi:hypothetical protein
VITGRYHEFNVLINLLDKEWGFLLLALKKEATGT